MKRIFFLPWLLIHLYLTDANKGLCSFIYFLKSIWGGKTLGGKQMDNIIIRRTIPSDIPEIARILSTTEAWTCYDINYDTATKILETMKDDSYVAIWDNTVTGFITLRIDGVGNIGAYIRMVAVAKNFRGKQIGTKLIEFISNITFKETSNLFLICSVENTKAQSFYEKIGFEKVGILSDLVIKNHDEIFFRKTSGPMKK